MGPLCQSDLTGIHTRLSPIGLVPKSEPNQWRMIVDLFFPLGRGVNDGISSTLASVSYSSVDDDVRRILHLGKRTQLVKVDLKQAYRQVPVHPQDQHLLAVSWERSVCGSSSAIWVMICTENFHCSCGHDCLGTSYGRYLDYFLFLGPPATGVAARALSVALRILDHLDFPVAMHKIEGPTCCITFLGIIIWHWGIRVAVTSRETQ